MHSLKSTGIAVLLLAVSVGLYQFSANDEPSSTIDLSTELGVSDGSLPTFSNPPFSNPALSNPSLNGQPHGQPPLAHSQFSNPRYPNQQAPHPTNPQFDGRPYPPTYPPNGYPQTGMAPPTGQQFFPQQSTPRSPNAQLVSTGTYPHHYPQSASTQNQSPIQSQHRYPGVSGNNALQTNGSPFPPPASASPAPPTTQPELTGAPNFDALRSKFNQTADDISGAVTQQANQQFEKLQQQTVGTAQQFGNQLAADFSNDAQSLKQQLGNRANQFQQSMPDLAAATAATRQTIDGNRDDGLINALQTELNSAAQTISIDSASTSNFSAPSIQNDPEIKIENDFNSNDFSGNDFENQLKAQPIELTNDSENRLVSEQSSLSNDFNVQQANLAPPSDTSDPNAVANIDQAWVEVQELVDAEKFRDALVLLTRFYRNDDLTSSQRTKLNDWLDALAGKVIYSTENHFTSTAYKMKAGETLAEIATRWNVPAQVVYNINRKQIGNNPNVAAGTELKMINGPFHAEVDMSSATLTLFLKDLYAGRFPVKLGISGDPRPGQFNVVAKSVQGHTWRDADGNDFPPDAPENGYGPYWIGMTGSLCIHAINDDEIPGHSGCIGLLEKDAKDIFGILANRSQIKVVR